jgi:Na+-translocating ferredoxin:NAD+ oxidoreductase RnfG subunit
MKKSNLLFILFTIVATSMTSTSSYSHVVPQDELNNQVYLSTNEALKKVFEGVRKIKKEKRKISRTQQKQIEDILQRKSKDQRISLYTARKDDRKIYATLGKATANSHPGTEAKFVLLIDSQGQLKDIHIMEYRGPQRAEIISRPFLDQYINKSAESDFSAVVSNQGPTPSVQALSREVHEILVLFKVLYLN